MKMANLYLSARIPVITPRLAVEYFFVCSPRHQQGR